MSLYVCQKPKPNGNGPCAFFALFFFGHSGVQCAWILEVCCMCCLYLVFGLHEKHIKMSLRRDHRHQTKPATLDVHSTASRSIAIAIYTNDTHDNILYVFGMKRKWSHLDLLICSRNYFTFNKFDVVWRINVKWKFNI